MWLQLANKSYKIKPMDHFVGISIKKVACAPNVNLVCMISDRGILMTKGINKVLEKKKKLFSTQCRKT